MNLVEAVYIFSFHWIHQFQHLPLAYHHASWDVHTLSVHTRYFQTSHIRVFPLWYLRKMFEILREQQFLRWLPIYFFRKVSVYVRWWSRRGFIIREKFEFLLLWWSFSEKREDKVGDWSIAKSTKYFVHPPRNGHHNDFFWWKYPDKGNTHKYGCIYCLGNYIREDGSKEEVIPESLSEKKCEYIDILRTEISNEWGDSDPPWERKNRIIGITDSCIGGSRPRDSIGKESPQNKNYERRKSRKNEEFRCFLSIELTNDIGRDKYNRHNEDSNW